MKKKDVLILVCVLANLFLLGFIIVRGEIEGPSLHSIGIIRSAQHEPAHTEMLGPFLYREVPDHYRVKIEYEEGGWVLYSPEAYNLFKDHVGTKVDVTYRGHYLNLYGDERSIKEILLNGWEVIEVNSNPVE